MKFCIRTFAYFDILSVFRYPYRVHVLSPTGFSILTARSRSHSRSHTLVKKRPDKAAPAKATTNLVNGKKKEYNSSVCDWLNGEVGNGDYSSSTLYKRRHAPIRQSSSVGHLVTLGRLSTAPSEKEAAVFDKKIKRTKSLWKFKKADDVLEGMSLWKHRSLVDINSSSSAGAAGVDPTFSRGTPVLDKRMTVTREISVDSGDENSTIMNGVSGSGLISNAGTQGKAAGKSSQLYESRRRVDVSDESDSDQESCIVVDDHRKTDSVESNKLPRTHLAKANGTPAKENGFKEYKDNESDMVFESNKLQTFKYNTMANSWYDSWGERRKKWGARCSKFDCNRSHGSWWMSGAVGRLFGDGK